MSNIISAQLRKKIHDFSYQETYACQSIPYNASQYACHLAWDELLPSPERPYTQTSKKHENIQDLLVQWVTQQETTPYCLLLGEYGMGKTISCMHFTRRLLQNPDLSPYIPIYFDLRTLSDQTSILQAPLPSILNTILLNSSSSGKTPYGSLHADEIIHLAQHGKILVIYDGLDEILVHLSRPQGQLFTQSLLSILPPDIIQNTITSGRILLSCRTHFFKSTSDQKSFFSNQATFHPHYFSFLLLQPFSQQQIKDYLEHAVPDMEIEQLLALIRSVHNLSELSERPYTLSLIPLLIPYISQWKEAGSQITGVMIYRHFVLSWLERDQGKHTITPEHKILLMEDFSADLWRSGKQSWDINYLASWFSKWMNDYPDIRMHYLPEKDNENTFRVLEFLMEDLMAATLLVRVGDNDFRFAHTSLKEFFLASYLFNSAKQEKLLNWNMPVVSKETLNFLGQLWNQEHQPNLNFLKTIHRSYTPKVSELAFAYMIHAHQHHYPASPIRGMCLNGAQLQNWSIIGTPEKLLDLSHIQLEKACLEYCDFQHLDLSYANFSDARLFGCTIYDSQASFAYFKKADLSKAWFRETNFNHANFECTAAHHTRWIRCSLIDQIGLQNTIINQEFFTTYHSNSSFQNQSILEASQQLSNHHTDAISRCIFTTDAHHLITASWDTSICIWDIETSKCIHILKGHASRVRTCLISPDQKYILSSSDDKTIRIWDIKTGKCIDILDFKPMNCTIRDFKYFPHQHQLLITYKTGLLIYDIEQKKELYSFSGHTKNVKKCAISPNGEIIISASEDGTLKSWNTKTKELLNTFEGHTFWVQGVAFSSCGNKIVSASWDKTLRLWDTHSGECLHILSGHEDSIRECTFFPENKHVLSVSNDQSARIWDTANGKCLNILLGHTDRVQCCSISSNAKLIATGSEDCEIRLWNATTGEYIKTLR